MKSTTSIIYALAVFSLQLENVSAMLGFSFSNLLFAMNLCHIPDNGWCKATCKSHKGPHPPIPPGPKDFCENECVTDSSTRRLSDSGEFSWTQAACNSFDSNGEAYTRCVKLAVADCAEVETDSNLEYTEYTAYNYTQDQETNNFEGGNTSGVSAPIASKTSFLPYMVAASVSSMFLILYVWKKRNGKKEQLLKEDLMADENQSFHGSVARRIDRARSSAVPLPTVIEMESGTAAKVTTGYAMA